MKESCEWCKPDLRFECCLIDDEGNTASVNDNVVQTVIATFCPHCGRKLEDEPHMSNADRIRSMTDKEIADFLCDTCQEMCKFCNGISGTGFVLAWLKKDEQNEKV